MMRIFETIALVATLFVGCGGADEAAPGSRYAIGVVELELGEGAGFGAEMLPDIVLGPPRGGGLSAGSVDTLSLGLGGSIVLELGTDVVDGPGPDVIIFENAFQFGGAGIFTEPGTVSFSADGTAWAEVPCDPESPMLEGCAGRTPVYAHAEDNDIDPTDPESAGGDSFDLASVAMRRARYVRIVDSGIDFGFGTDNRGFDLDAIAVINGD